MNKRTPSQVAGITFGVVILLGVFSIAAVTLFTPTGAGELVSFLSQATCPAALIAGGLAYWTVKNNQ